MLYEVITNNKEIQKIIKTVNSAGNKADVANAIKAIHTIGNQADVKNAIKAFEAGNSVDAESKAKALGL